MIRHDPKGKVRLKLAQGVKGDACFHGEGDKYRLWLSRSWAECTDPRFALIIGMNPSTADADVDDPTLQFDTRFVRSWGLRGFFKCNVMDYRATYPADLLKPGVVACSEQNIPTIRRLAASAAKIVIAHGNIDKKFQRYADDVVYWLRRDGHQLFCFGLNKNGSPRHSLYLKSDTPLVEYGVKRCVS